MMNLRIGSSIVTTRGKGTITSIGAVHYKPNAACGWAMLTVDLDADASGGIAYAAARHDELAIEYAIRAF